MKGGQMKKYTFSKEELERLQDIEVGTISFTQAVQGMILNKQITLRAVYERLGIELNPKDVDRKIEYNLKDNWLTVTDTPKKKLANK